MYSQYDSANGYFTEYRYDYEFQYDVGGEYADAVAEALCPNQVQGNVSALLPGFRWWNFGLACENNGSLPFSRNVPASPLSATIRASMSCNLDPYSQGRSCPESLLESCLSTIEYYYTFSYIVLNE